jgi:hypothetical protein
MFENCCWYLIQSAIVFIYEFLEYCSCISLLLKVYYCIRVWGGKLANLKSLLLLNEIKGPRLNKIIFKDHKIFLYRASLLFSQEKVGLHERNLLFMV